MKTHTYLLAFVLAFFSLIQHTTAQQSMQLPDSALTYRCDTLTGRWTSLRSSDYWQWNAHNDLTQHDRRDWDSAAWTYDSRELYIYDAAHHLTGTTCMMWDAGVWDTLSIHTYGYDVSGVLVSGLQYRYPSPWTGQGPPGLLVSIYADDITRPLQQTGLTASGTGGWDSTYRWLWRYASGTDTSIMQVWDTAATAWRNGSMDIHTPGHLASYNGNGTTWTFFGTYDTTYDGHGYPTLVQATWYYGQQANSRQERHTYTYDGSGYLLTDQYDLYQGSTWQNNGNDTFTYDAAGRRLTARYTHPVLSTVDSAWTYDNLGYIDHCTLRITNTRFYGDSTQYYYHRAVSTGVHGEALAADIAAYPVPAHGDLIVAIHATSAEILTTTLTDMAGRRVLSTTLSDGQNHLNVSAVPAGVYEMMLTDSNGGRASRRVVLY